MLLRLTLICSTSTANYAIAQMTTYRLDASAVVVTEAEKQQPAMMRRNFCYSIRAANAKQRLWALMKFIRQ